MPQHSVFFLSLPFSHKNPGWFGGEVVAHLNRMVWPTEPPLSSSEMLAYVEIKKIGSERSKLVPPYSVILWWIQQGDRRPFFMLLSVLMTPYVIWWKTSLCFLISKMGIIISQSQKESWRYWGLLNRCLLNGWRSLEKWCKATAGDNNYSN